MPDWVFHLGKGICISKITQEIQEMSVQISQNNQPEEIRKDFEMKLIAKAWTDEAFRQQLLSNPKAVVEQEFGSALPEGINVEIIQEPANTLYMVLPAKVESNEELNEEELEVVTGGLIAPMYGVGYVPGQVYIANGR
ncbi:NHLP leader peptide family RiPP precursor [Scytonema sp. NUACC26]|uniref:NHLP leader peptide family RiPP precursor n=1 Tax=Scytonema sp. NUACC26 TaxID=3140176 RepID=UPI0034DCBDD2